MILFDNLDRERKTLSFTALHTILVCEVCASYYFFFSYTLQEKATSVPISLKMLIFVSTDRLMD